jgi:hypothetical protein
LSISDKKRFSPNISLIGIYTMLGFMLIYLFHGMNGELPKQGFPAYYEFPILDATLNGFLLGLINFVAISFFIDQAIRKKNRFREIAKSLLQPFSQERNSKNMMFTHVLLQLSAR